MSVVESFSVRALAAVLDGLAVDSNTKIAVAFSGGQDSAALLHALASLATERGFGLRALHVNHGLQNEAANWESYCRAECRQLGVEYQSGSVVVSTENGQSPEAAAREARYSWLFSRLLPDELLALAHHADDQFETIVLRLLRGAGATGLRGMAYDSIRNGHRLIRPLLKFTRDDLTSWLTTHNIQWIEDPSNQDPRFDRSYLRDQVLPTITARWPNAAIQASRSGEYLRDLTTLAESVSREDLRLARPATPPFGGGPVLSCQALGELTDVRLVNALRSWFMRLIGLPPPRKRILTLIELIRSPKGHGEIMFRLLVVRRFRDGLYFISRSTDGAKSEAAGKGLNELWAPGPKNGRALTLIPGFRLSWRVALGRGLSQSQLNNHGSLRLVSPQYLIDLKIPFAIRIDGHSRDFKSMCQRLGVPPWDRRHLPVLCTRSLEIVAVAGVCTSDEWAAAPDEDSIEFFLHRLHGFVSHETSAGTC